jgi:5-methylthioadenosine/S-adenosylhomocysteine deaminase
MTCKHTTRWRSVCPCCDGGVAQDRRHLLFGGAMLGVASSAGLFAGVTGAAAQGPPNPGTTVPPRSGNFILRGGYVLTMDRGLGDIPIGDVHVRNGEIAAVASSVEAPGAEIVNAKGMIVMPGFVETHSHVWNALLKNMPRSGAEYFALKDVFGKHHAPIDYYRANRLFLTEALNAGITTVVNYAHNTQSPAHVDEEVRAMMESGLRGRYAYGGPDPYPREKMIDLQDILRVKRQWFGPGSGSLIDLGFGLRAPAPVGSPPPPTYPQEFRFARDNGLPIILHSGFPPNGMTPSKLKPEGFVDQSMIFVHSLRFDQRDRDTMAETGASNAFSLFNDMRNQRDIELRLQILEMVRAGVNICLSHDATSLNPTSMFDQMRLALHIAAPVVNTPVANITLTQTQCLEMGTINGTKAMGLADRVGPLTSGKRADMIMLRATDLNMMPFTDGHAAVLHSAATANVDTVIVDGRILKFGGKIFSVDVEAVQREAAESFYLIRQRAGDQWAPRAWERPV